ncbi:hypothetical protein P6P90_06890 [Ectobacillus antri]|uniref:Lipoprotein n=1 Tax=Ectobacillus antri TaxID=2486280 RepID=A0ABT6H3Z3_9BACI|nr:hypothetical protein [Ectobacillus antri]MDG4658062.1 hypothetical protein [Ectobacillus antri]MDG5753697.1 hypothetical protein [Ectobacillus antri]
MKRLSFLLVVLLLTSCQQLKQANPPQAVIMIGEHSYDTTVGSYCWKHICADTEAPAELLKGKTPIIVKGGEQIKLQIDYQTKPDEVILSKHVIGYDYETVAEKSEFQAPIEKGVYYYGYSVRWFGKKNPEISKGDAVYAFVLEIK